MLRDSFAHKAVEWDFCNTTTHRVEVSGKRVYELSNGNRVERGFTSSTKACEHDHGGPFEGSIDQWCGPDDYPIVRVTVTGVRVVDLDHEDTVPGEVFVNSDDDNNTTTQDRQENPVSGKNDLISLTPTIQPAELTLGQVTVTAPESQGGLALWKQSNKVGAPEASWSPYVMPRGLWVEGTDVSTTPGDKELKLTHSCTWNNEIRYQLHDTVHLTVQPRNQAENWPLRCVVAWDVGRCGRAWLQ